MYIKRLMKKMKKFDVIEIKMIKDENKDE